MRDLKRRLVERGLSAWLDEDELPPGQPWLPLIEQAIRNSDSVAVCVGSSGLGPWEDEEMQAALRLAVKLKRPVIPVLLPGAPAQPELPLFLDNRTYVDARGGFTEEALARLVWGITHQVPPAPPVQTPGLPPPSGPAPGPGRAKNDFCDRLGDDWERLANELVISVANQRQIAARHAGAEGRGLWEFLEVRTQLARLAPACRAIDRADLADALPPDLGASPGPPNRPR